MKLRLDEYYSIINEEWEDIESYMPEDMAEAWDGLLNVTQTGMNSSGEPFAFSMDNDRSDQQKLIDTLVKAQVEGWKVKIKYHQVWGAKNVFKNRGESDYFVDDVIVLDKNFSKIGDIVKGTNKTAPHDTLYVKIVK